MSALDVQVGGEHYKDSPIQPVQYIEANELAFLEGCVIKRCTRHNKPTGKGRQDIEKAIHELQILLELRYPAPPEFTPSVTVPGLTCPTDCPVCGQPGGHSGIGCPKMRAQSEYIYPNT